MTLSEFYANSMMPTHTNSHATVQSSLKSRLALVWCPSHKPFILLTTHQPAPFSHFECHRRIATSSCHRLPSLAIACHVVC